MFLPSPVFIPPTGSTGGVAPFCLYPPTGCRDCELNGFGGNSCGNVVPLPNDPNGMSVNLCISDHDEPPA